LNVQRIDVMSFVFLT